MRCLPLASLLALFLALAGCALFQGGSKDDTAAEGMEEEYGGEDLPGLPEGELPEGLASPDPGEIRPRAPEPGLAPLGSPAPRGARPDDPLGSLGLHPGG